MYGRCGKGIFPRARDHCHGTDSGLQTLDLIRRRALGLTDNLERKLRNPVAKATKIKVFDHDIGRPPITRSVSEPLDRFDLGVGQLILVAGIEPQIQRVRRNFDAIRPDAPDAQNTALTQGNRQTY